MSNRSAELLIEDILASAQKIQRYTTEMSFEQFISDERTVDNYLPELVIEMEKLKT